MGLVSLIMSTDNEKLFAAERAPKQGSSNESPWKLLVVDDEKSVHDVTRLALSGFSFEGRSLDVLRADSAAEAMEILQQDNDIAIALIDVVMETDQAGLDLVRWIRKDLGNESIRLIIRTGQPGLAPEKQIILNYDICDYKEKTELTSAKLFTLVVAGLRGYRNLVALEKNRQGLERIALSSNALSTRGSLETFIEGVMIQLQSVLCGDETAFYSRGMGILGSNGESDPNQQIVVAGTGDYEGCASKRLSEIASPKLLGQVERVLKEQKTCYLEEGGCIIYFRSSYGNHCLLYLNGCPRVLDSIERDLVGIFCHNTSYAFDNLHLNREIENTQREVIYTLGSIAEFRSKETGRHIARVSRNAEQLAILYGMSQEESDLILLAMPMHDVGKIAIPDAILHKPGRLTPQEMEVIKTHAQIGYEMLCGSKRKLFRSAAIIARQHHEWWNGDGYPNGLSGDKIHLYGRIAAVADVFDALGYRRCYKDAWPMERIIEHYKKFRGVQFDPEITDLLLDNIDRFEAIRQNYPDEGWRED